MYTYCLSKKAKKVYVTVLLFILYPICVHVESPKDLPKITQIKWNCFYLPNSGQKSLTMLILSFLMTIQWIFEK